MRTRAADADARVRERDVDVILASFDKGERKSESRAKAATDETWPIRDACICAQGTAVATND